MPVGSASRRQPNAAEIPRQRDPGTHGVPFFLPHALFQIDMDTYTFTLSLPALATMIAGFLTELDLRHVTLVCNDSPSPSAPCPSGGFPTTCSGVGSIRCATTPRSAATSPSASATSPKPQELLEWADQQRTFAGSVLIIWARHDKLMPPTHAARLAEHFENTHLVWIDDSRTLIPIDQPAVLADHLHGFLAKHR